MGPISGELLAYWNEQIVPRAGALAVRVLLALLALVVVAVAARFARRAVRRALTRTSAHANAQLLIERLIQFAFLLTAIAWVLSIFGVQLTALLAVVGVAGLAASLAMQDVLKNLVAGLYILIERPFGIGERIEFKSFSGTVETIALRTTALRTQTGQRVVIPNSMLFADTVVNRSTNGRHLVRLRVAIPLAGADDADKPAPAPPSPMPAARVAPQFADQMRAAIREAVAAAEQPEKGESEPVVMLESITSEKVTLRAEVWVADARTTAPRAAWSVHERLPRAEITVLE